MLADAQVEGFLCTISLLQYFDPESSYIQNNERRFKLKGRYTW